MREARRNFRDCDPSDLALPPTAGAHSLRQKPSLKAILLIVLLLSHNFTPMLVAQSAPPTPAQLDQLLAPIALYPDALLAQITTASTSPQQILDVANWLQANAGLEGAALTDAAAKQGFDPAFIALVNFPQVMDMMAQNIDDYAAIGEAFMADQAAVAASVQRLRARAFAAGALRTNSQQTVVVQHPAGQTIYVIQPASPQVVYVPQYNPTAVYVAPSSGAVATAALISFGVGITIGALVASNQPWGWSGWGWNWRSRSAYYNHTAWVGWRNPYRPPQVWYRPRPVLYTGRPGYGGNWAYRPPNYRPPYNAAYRPGGRPPYGPGNQPGYRPPTNYPSRPPANNATRPPASNPARPPVNASRPPANNATRPPAGNPARPPVNASRPPANNATRPPAGDPARPPSNRPSRPPSASQGRPQPQNKPTPNSKPAPKAIPSTQP
jgi:hypothetical protein